MRDAENRKDGDLKVSRGIKYQMYIKWRRDVAKGSIILYFCYKNV